MDGQLVWFPWEKQNPQPILWVFFAESKGFEPLDLLQSTVFKTAAFDHSANSPNFRCEHLPNSDANIESFFIFLKEKSFYFSSFVSIIEQPYYLIKIE